jgi:hypothetical protein
VKAAVIARRTRKEQLRSGEAVGCVEPGVGDG